MPARRPARAVATVLGALALGAGAPSCGGDEGAERADAPVRGGAAAVAPRLLDGGPDAFRRRLKSLQGTPVVVNQWASWCGPCKFEFPFFQRLAARYAGRVAFLGVNSQDSRDSAEAFLRELPTPFEHYFDQDVSIARTFRGGLAWPTTAFFDARGRRTKVHAGAYASQAKLEQDIRGFALAG